jgi:DNA mismatch endonuclease (patch repair protein)
MDSLSKAERSKLMGKIRWRGNKATELAMVAFLRRHMIFGWRRNQPLTGRPDFVFRSARVAVFVDGCFWHGCAVHYRMPASTRHYWRAKLARNRARDRLVNRTLRAAGWRVLRIWEHELAGKREGRLRSRLRRVLGS